MKTNKSFGCGVGDIIAVITSARNVRVQSDFNGEEIAHIFLTKP